MGWDENGRIQALFFDIGDHAFAIPAALVREILDPMPETQVPGSDPLTASITNFRGRIIPLSNLRRAFGLAHGEDNADARIVVIELAIDDHPCLIGLKVDKVHEVAAIKRERSEPPPPVGLRFPRELVRCLIKRRGTIVAIPDLERIYAALPFSSQPALH